MILYMVSYMFVKSVRSCFLMHIDLHASYKKQHTLKQTFLPIQKGPDESMKSKQITYKRCLARTAILCILEKQQEIEAQG